MVLMCFFFFQAEDGIRDLTVTGVQTCALPICASVPDADWLYVPPTVKMPGSPIGVLTSVMVIRPLLFRTLVPLQPQVPMRSEERRVGKECRCRWSTYQEIKKKKDDERQHEYVK